MGRSVELSREAIAEFNEAVDWYAKRSRGAAIGFVSAVDAALERISAAPDALPSTFAGCRYCSLNRYPYQVVFHDVGNRLVIVAIAHGKRRPATLMKCCGLGGKMSDDLREEYKFDYSKARQNRFAAELPPCRRRLPRRSPRPDGTVWRIWLGRRLG